jgi:hypothetical protein
MKINSDDHDVFPSLQTTRVEQERLQLAAAEESIDSLKAPLNAGPGKL